jgi:hypothetical protein
MPNSLKSRPRLGSKRREAEYRDGQIANEIGGAIPDFERLKGLGRRHAELSLLRPAGRTLLPRRPVLLAS